MRRTAPANTPDALHDFPGHPQGIAQGQPGPARVHLQPRHAAARDRRRHGRPCRRRDRRADRRAPVHRALPAGSQADRCKQSAQVPAGDRCCGRTRRLARTPTSSRCSRRRARPVSPCIVQANHAYWAHVGDSRFYLFRQGGADRRRPRITPRCSTSSTRASSPPTRCAIIRTATRSSAAWAASSIRSSTCRKRTPLRNGDVHGDLHRRPLERVCRRTRWRVRSRGTPILKTAPQPDARGRAARRAPRATTCRPSSCAGARRHSPTSRRPPSPRRSASASSRPQIDRTLTLTDRKGAAARPHRRRDRARDPRNPGDHQGYKMTAGAASSRFEDDSAALIGC